jgi:hypothetical protein
MRLNANVDLIGHGGASQGEIAAMLMRDGRLDPGFKRPWVNVEDGKTYVTVYTGGDPALPESYRDVQVNATGTLRPDEWKTLDAAVLAISEKRLGGIADLVAAGLTYDLGNGMGTTVLEYHDISDAMEAVLTMDGVTRGQGDRPVFSPHYLPLPIVHVDYEINARVLAVSRALGNPLDTTSAERASRKVNEKLEAMLFTNTTYAFGGGTIYSYINHPDRNLYTLGTAWTADTAANILADVIGMKQKSIDAYHFGPWALYIPVAYETVMDKDYDTTSHQTIRQRILAIDGINAVKVCDTLPSGNVLLVQMTSDVVRLVRGMGIQNIEWNTEGGMVTKFKVMTIQVPQIRSDQDGNSGIVHAA